MFSHALHLTQQLAVRLLTGSSARLTAWPQTSFPAAFPIFQIAPAGAPTPRCGTFPAGDDPPNPISLDHSKGEINTRLCEVFQIHPALPKHMPPSVRTPHTLTLTLTLSWESTLQLGERPEPGEHSGSESPSGAASGSHTWLGMRCWAAHLISDTLSPP